MNLIYDGPEGQVNHEVGLALAARSTPADVELRGVSRDVVGTDDLGATALLEPGKVYDLPAELAERLLSSSDYWARVADFAGLTKAELQQIAAERGVEGRSKMSADELVAAIRATDPPDVTPEAPAAVGPDPGGVPRDETGEPLHADEVAAVEHDVDAAEASTTGGAA